MPPVRFQVPPNSCYEYIATGICSTPYPCPFEHTTIARLCVACNRLFPSIKDHHDHTLTEKHEKAVRKQVIPKVPNNWHLCVICRCIFPEGNQSHYRGRQHAKKSKAASIRLQSLTAEANVGNPDIVIDGSSKMGVAQLGEEISHPLLVTTTRGPFNLIRFTFVLTSGISSTLFDMKGETENFLSSQHPIPILVSFRHSVLGHYTCNLELTFQSHTTRQIYIVTKKLIAIVGERRLHKELAATKPFVPRPIATRQPETKVTAGALPPCSSVISYKKRLPPACIPSGLVSAISQGSMREVLANVRNGHLPEAFGHGSYGSHFDVLLWIEEAKAEEDMLMYDMEGVTLEPHKTRYWLTVPGLAEKRPSVLPGDRILIRRQSDKEGHWYEGRVWTVQQLRVDLQLPSKTAKITAQSPCHVRFKLNRDPLKKQHHALSIAGIPDWLTFPNAGHVHTPLDGVALTSFFNPDVQHNPRQRDAVNAIIARPPGSIPFVIFGPPGTGKTVTVVEAINQILERDATARILACAPSNSAADIIAQRLIPLGNKRLFRLYAPSRLKILVDEELLPFTYTHKDGPFSVPDLAQLMAFRVVVTTCVSAYIPFGVGVPKGHFTHIFIDEAGQATEPEAMVSIRTVVDETTNVVLSGDPKQLGPVIRSGVARELGLGKSYLERLMENTILYDETSTDATSNVVKLTKNFRSHNAILYFPNSQFYKGELEQCGDPRIINSFVGSKLLPSSGKSFPIIFYALPGKDERESTSPSFFNIDEIIAVKDYVQQLKRLGIADEDIGIVAPYRAQCQKLRKALDELAGNIKIGSVEEFQGDERLVMIISTVRSSEDFLEYDARFTLGFVSNSRRFNVAVTRAKALLVVVGDPRVLSLDPLWRSFMNYVYNGGGWRGMTPDWDTMAPVNQTSEVYAQQRRQSAEHRINELTARLQSLNVADDTAGVDRPVFVEVE